jgi:hypothetical protein
MASQHFPPLWVVVQDLPEAVLAHVPGTPVGHCHHDETVHLAAVTEHGMLADQTSGTVD